MVDPDPCCVLHCSYVTTFGTRWPADHPVAATEDLMVARYKELGAIMVSECVCVEHRNTPCTQTMTL